MMLDASVFRSNVEVPIDHTIVTISLLEPFVCLGEMTTVKLEVWSAGCLFSTLSLGRGRTYEAFVCTQRARVNALENVML